MIVTVYENYDDFIRYGQPGDLCTSRNIDGKVTSLIQKCVGCGNVALMSVRNLGEPHPDHPSWEMIGFPENITLTPSIWHKSGCGWHGYLENGKYRHV